MTTSPLQASRHQLAILEAEARALARICASYGVVTGHQLVELSEPKRWTRGRFSAALTLAIEQGMIRDLGCGFYAAPSSRDADDEPGEARTLRIRGTENPRKRRLTPPADR